MQWIKRTQYGFARYTCGVFTLAEATTRTRKKAGWGNKAGWREVQTWNVLVGGQVIGTRINTLRDAKAFAAEYAASWGISG